MDCIVHGVTKSRRRLSDFHFHPLLLPTSRAWKRIFWQLILLALGGLWLLRFGLPALRYNPFPSPRNGICRGRVQVALSECPLEGWGVAAVTAAQAFSGALPPCKKQRERAPEQAGTPLPTAPTPQASGSPHPHGCLPSGQNATAERQLHGSPVPLVRSRHPSHSENTPHPTELCPRVPVLLTSPTPAGLGTPPRVPLR